MEKNVNRKQEVSAMAVVDAQVVEYVDKMDADREGRIVGEIRMITEQTKQVVLMASIEIGRRLTEAKSLVRHGQWSAWLKDRIDYSQRTANNFMRIYREYGETGIAEKSQSIANLSYTHALALLDVPAEERAKFAEERNAKDMKIKELQEEIKALNEQRNRDGEKYGKLIAGKMAEKEALAASAKERQHALEQQILRLERQAREAGEAQQAEVKKQIDLAVAKEHAELERAGERVRDLQAEITQLAEEQRKEIERVRKQEQVAAQSEIAKRDKLIAQTREEMKAELERAQTELEKSRKEVKEEQEKNRLAENLAICAFAIDELLDRYAVLEQ